MKTCPHCNGENADDARFCVGCGRYFGSFEKNENTEEDLFNSAEAPFNQPPQAQNPLFAPSSQRPEPTPSSPQQFQSPKFPMPSPRENVLPPPPARPMPRPTEEEIFVENHTAYTKQILKDLYKTSKILSILLIVLGGQIFLLTLYERFRPDPEGDDVFLGISVSVALVFLGLFYLLYLNSVIGKSRLFNDTTVVVYRFLDKGMLAQTFDGDQTCGEEYLLYHKITTVYKSKTLILLRSGMHIVFVRRDGFVKGDEARLREVLSARCPNAKIKI